MKSVCRRTMNVEQSICQVEDRQIDGYISEMGLGEIKQ